MTSNYHSMEDIRANPLPFLHLMSRLKNLPRTGWLRTIERPESVAAHTFRVAILCLFAPQDLDLGRCIHMALCHDMAESVVGDIPTFAGVPKEVKYKLESLGFELIVSLLSSSYPEVGAKIQGAWLEYEANKTPEARYVQEVDKLDCLLQAHEYEQATFGEKDLEEFQGLSSKLHSRQGKLWLGFLNEEREAHLAKRRERTPVIFVIGGSRVSQEAHCSFLSNEFGFQDVTLNEVLREKADDPKCPHAAIITRYMEENIPVPEVLAIMVLESRIKEGSQSGMSWTLVRGFPENMPCLNEFREQVQKTNYTLFLKDGHNRPAVQGKEEEKIIECLKVDGYFTQIEEAGTIKEAIEQSKVAVRGFINHAKGEVPN